MSNDTKFKFQTDDILTETERGSTFIYRVLRTWEHTDVTENGSRIDYRGYDLLSLTGDNRTWNLSKDRVDSRCERIGRAVPADYVEETINAQAKKIEDLTLTLSRKEREHEILQRRYRDEAGLHVKEDFDKVRTQNRKIEDLESQLGSMQRVLERKAVQFSRLNEHATKLDTRVLNLQVDVDNLKKANHSLHVQRDRVQAAYDTCITERDAALESYRAMVAGNQNLEKQRASRDETIARMTLQVDVQASNLHRIEMLCSTLRTERDSYSMQVGSLTNELAKVRRDRDEIDLRVGALTHALEGQNTGAATKQYVDMTGMIDTLRAELCMRNVDLDGARKKIEELEAKLKVHEVAGHVTAAVSKAFGVPESWLTGNALVKEVEALKKKLAEAEGVISELRTQLAHCSEYLRVQTKLAEERLLDLVVAKDHYEAERTHRKKAESKLESAQKELAHAQASVTHLNNRVRELGDAESKLKGLQNALELEQSKLCGEIASRKFVEKSYATERDTRKRLEVRLAEASLDLEKAQMRNVTLYAKVLPEGFANVLVRELAVNHDGLSIGVPEDDKRAAFQIEIATVMKWLCDTYGADASDYAQVEEPALRATKELLERITWATEDMEVAKSDLEEAKSLLRGLVDENNNDALRAARKYLGDRE